MHNKILYKYIATITIAILQIEFLSYTNVLKWRAPYMGIFNGTLSPLIFINKCPYRTKFMNNYCDC